MTSPLHHIRVSSSLGHLPALLLLLSIVLAGAGAFDTVRVYRITDRLAAREALGLVHQVESSVLTATLAEQAVRTALTDHLFAVAHLVGEELPGVSQNYNLDRLASLSGVSRIELEHYAKSSSAVDQTGESVERELGVYEHQGQQLFGVELVSSASSIRVSISGAELSNLRDAVGLPALLHDLGNHFAVRYAVLDSPQGLLAATPDPPSWLNSDEDPAHSTAIAATDFSASFIQTPDGPVYEACAPFGENGSAVLRLGLDTADLLEIRQGSTSWLVIRTILLIALGGLSAWLLVSRRNLHYLQEERAAIETQVRQLQANRALSERHAAMGALAGGVAHEIRNPLNTVAMACQRLLHEFKPDKDADEYKDLIQAMRSEVERIGRIISEFLEFARPPRPQMRLENLQPILQEIELAFRPLTEEKGVTLECDPGRSLEMVLDADQLRQALHNLLRNALEATPPGGRIELRVSREKEHVRLVVSDSGHGIPEEVQNRIFDLYYTTRASGTGIGLAVVHRVAMEHGGRIALDHSDDSGSEFHLLLRRDLQTGEDA